MNSYVGAEVQRSTFVAPALNGGEGTAAWLRPSSPGKCLPTEKEAELAQETFG